MNTFSSLVIIWKPIFDKFFLGFFYGDFDLDLK